MHASETDLALFAGGDLDFWARWRVARHARVCDECRDAVEQFRAARARLKEAAQQLPPGVDWNKLSAEMTANIHLGLSAGECVAPVVKPAELTGWRPAAVLAGVALVMTVAWYANHLNPIIPSNLVQTPPVAAEPRGVFLEASATGIELNDHGRVLSLQHPKNSDVTLSMSLNTVRARYVDSESGQVTINNVYVQ